MRAMESEYSLEQPKSFLCRVKRNLMPAPGGSQAGGEDTSEKCQDKGDGRPSLKPREVVEGFLEEEILVEGSER